MKKITQKECLRIWNKTPFEEGCSENIFVSRFMFLLNDLAKKRGYRLFSWTEFMVRDAQVVGSWIISNIESLSKKMCCKANER